MDIEHCDQRSGLRELVLQFIADPKFQSRSLRAATLGCAIVLVLLVANAVGAVFIQAPPKKSCKGNMTRICPFPPCACATISEL
jgi:hypothetical protein